MRKRTEESKLHLVNDEQMKDFTLKIDTDLEDVYLEDIFPAVWSIIKQTLLLISTFREHVDINTHTCSQIYTNKNLL